MPRWESNFRFVEDRRRVDALEDVFSQPLTEGEARAHKIGTTYALTPTGESLVLSHLRTIDE